MGIPQSTPLSTEVSCAVDPTSTNYAGSPLWSAASGRIFDGQCNQDASGTVLSMTTSTTLYDCVQACGAVADCKAVSWKYDDGTCTQRGFGYDTIDSVDTVIFTQSFLCYIEPSICNLPDDFPPTSNNDPPTCPSSNGQSYTRSGGSQQFTIECDVDYAGVGDLGWSYKDTFQDCVDGCDTTDGCVAVVYSGTACYQKNTYSGSGTSAPGLSAAVLAGFAPAATPDCPAADGTTWTDGPVTYNIHCNADYAGGDLTSTPAASFSECISACTDNTQCVDVSYVSGTCYLKSHLTTMGSSGSVWTAVQQSAANQPSVPASSWDGSLITCPSTSPVSYTSNGVTFEIDCDTDYAGGDFQSTQADTLKACVDTCAQNSECVGLAYLGVGCYMKSSLSPAVPNSGVIGVKVTSTVTAE